MSSYNNAVDVELGQPLNMPSTMELQGMEVFRRIESLDGAAAANRRRATFWFWRSTRVLRDMYWGI